MEFTISKASLTGDAMKHGVIIHKVGEEDIKVGVTIVRYTAIPQVIDLLLDYDISFSSAMKRINNTIGLDDELFTIVSENQKSN